MRPIPFVISIGIDLPWLHQEVDFVYKNGPFESEELPNEDVAVVLYHKEAAHDFVESLHKDYPFAVIFSDGELYLPDCSVTVLESYFPEKSTRSYLKIALFYWKKLTSLEPNLALSRSHVNRISEISTEMASHNDKKQLLDAILTESRKLASCDAASLYLVNQEKNELHFYMSQNFSSHFEFKEQKMPLSNQSVAGYVALTGREVNIKDVYSLGSEDSNEFYFNRDFDHSANYRTVSMLVIPMRGHENNIVGVLQLINRKKLLYSKLTAENALKVTVEFDEDITALLRMLANQAAIFLQKNRLISSVRGLFDKFAEASMRVIEQRDPGTKGHSLRVASTTTALLEALPQSNLQRFRGIHFSKEQILETRYAALLHDFGKVAVSEKVLLKRNKIEESRLEVIFLSIQGEKERLKAEALKEQLELFHHPRPDTEAERKRILYRLNAGLNRLSEFKSIISQLNMPGKGASKAQKEALDALFEYQFIDHNGVKRFLLNSVDKELLSLKNGNLTREERMAIESHVVHTKEFLMTLPWPLHLADVPIIAGAHHEKLDGSGYPDGLRADEIPLQAKVMTVCDIYDALVAFDRPYKTEMSAERALAILHEEAKQGLIDRDIVQVFQDAKIFEINVLERGSKCQNMNRRLAS